jgi:hypothetical protein
MDGQRFTLPPVSSIHFCPIAAKQACTLRHTIKARLTVTLKVNPLAPACERVSRPRDGDGKAR